MQRWSMSTTITRHELHRVHPAKAAFHYVDAPIHRGINPAQLVLLVKESLVQQPEPILIHKLHM